MPEYNGNAIYDYIKENDLDYFFCIENEWILLYGNRQSTPHLVVYVSEINNIDSDLSAKEITSIDKSKCLANSLKLPFVCVRFKNNSNEVLVWQPDKKDNAWQRMTYDQLRDLYEEYGVVSPGTPRKAVNQYVSSSYQDWQRGNLGRITVSDFDLVRFRNGIVEEIIELKRAKYSLEKWSPFTNDYPNFALLINSIIGSGKKIPFTLYYNYMKDGAAGMRTDDISKIKAFDFVVPDRQINCQQIEYQCRPKFYDLPDLLN